MPLSGLPLYSTNYKSPQALICPQAPHKRNVFTDTQGENFGTSIAKDIYTDDHDAQQREVATCRDRRWDRRWLFDPMAEDRRVKSTFGSIRALLGDEMPNLNVENRILTVTISELSRPVAYFWSPHDFVRGVIGALLGHEYLCETGILHRDISENNIVLSPCRGGLGVLTGFDMAIVGRPNMHRDFTPPPEKSIEEILASFKPLPASDEQQKAQRIGTTPYMSIGVLRGESHTHFDDIESFFYVLVLFFLTYKGPLQKETLKRAWVQGFIQPVGVDRLPHVTPWPARFQLWTCGTFRQMSFYKADILSLAYHGDFGLDCIPHIRSRWEPASQTTPQALARLIFRCWNMFARQKLRVTHGQFTEVLREWLKEFAGEEDNYCYPFDD